MILSIGKPVHLSGRFTGESNTMPELPINSEPTQKESPVPAIYELDSQEFRIEFPVKWTGKEGRILVTHILRRPTDDEIALYRSKVEIERRYDVNSQLIGEYVNSASAAQWLWDQIAIGFEGYPGLDAVNLQDISRESADAYRKKMRAIHKEKAIDHAFEMSAVVLVEESDAQFDGGEWMVGLTIGENPEFPVYSMKFRHREWTEGERNQFERNARKLKTRTEGKTSIEISSIKAKAYGQIFDETSLSFSGCSVNGQLFSAAAHPMFKGAASLEIKVSVATALIKAWRGNLLD